MNQHKNYLAIIYHVAIIFFATTIGIGLYTLFGAHLRMPPKLSPITNRISKTANSASIALKNIVSSSTIKQNSDDNIIINLKNREEDYFTLKSTLIDSKIKTNKSYLVIFKQGDKEIKFPELLRHLSKIKPSNSLLRVMGDSRYYINLKDKHEGVIVSSITNPEIAFASIIGWESQFIETTLPLVHPLFSKNDIDMYLKLGAVSKKINSVDSRVIYKGENEIAYIWGIYKNNLIIAGSKDRFNIIISAIEK